MNIDERVTRIDRAISRRITEIEERVGAIETRIAKLSEPSESVVSVWAVDGDGEYISACESLPKDACREGDRGEKKKRL